MGGGGKVGTCVETEIGKVQHFSKVRRHNVGTRHTQARLTAGRIQVDLFPNRVPPPLTPQKNVLSCIQSLVDAPPH